MKNLKLSALFVAFAGLIAITGAGTAAATTLDCSSSGTMCTAPTKFHAVNEGHITLHAPVADTCEESTIEGTASTGTDANGETPFFTITVWTFSKCASFQNIVIKGGTYEIHTDTKNLHDGNGTVTSSGFELTIEGFGLHCIYGTNNTDIGTITGSRNAGSNTAKLIIKANILRVGGRSGAFCGGSTIEWTGTYLITTPDYLDVT